nr:FT-interacting protein 1-like [Tanacetum cinerariifolium]
MSKEEGDERTPGLQALVVAGFKNAYQVIIFFCLHHHRALDLSVKDRVGPDKDDVLGRCMLPLQYVDRRLDHKAINIRRFNLEKHVMVLEEEKRKEVKFASKIHMKYINIINGP